MRISVITVCLNASATIGETLRSVREQTHLNIEHIVVDGGSTDGTVDILAHSGCRFISEPDRGIYHAMNKGIAMATGEIIGFLNSDDLFHTRRAIEWVAQSADQADIVYGNVVIVRRHDTSQIVRYYSARHFKRYQMRFGQIPPHPATYIKRSLLISVGGFNEQYRISGDFDLMLRLIYKQRCSIRYIDKTLVTFRSGGVSSRGLSSLIAINKDILSSCRENGVWTNTPVLCLRYFTKFLQFFRRPSSRPE